MALCDLKALYLNASLDSVNGDRGKSTHLLSSNKCLYNMTTQIKDALIWEKDTKLIIPLEVPQAWRWYEVK
jgi:hypothetical protein